MTTRRDFIGGLGLGAAAAAVPLGDAIGALPPWWVRPATDLDTGLQDRRDRLPIAW